MHRRLLLLSTVLCTTGWISSLLLSDSSAFYTKCSFGSSFATRSHPSFSTMAVSASSAAPSGDAQIVSTTKHATSCAACGNPNDLLQCDTRKQRLGNIGSCQALCMGCTAKPEECSTFGKPITDMDAPEVIVGSICTPGGAFVKRKQQEKVFESLKGPSSETILRTISARFPWAIEIQQAAPSDLSEALQFCKRTLSGQRTIEALAENLANSNTHAAILLQHMGASVTGNSESIANKALRTFVKNQCPAIKYKFLLLPPSGSLLKAQRHFTDMLKVEDGLVVALAQERLLLINYFENQFQPLQSEKQRKRGYSPELPEFGLHSLRATLKSLSTGIKASARKDNDADTLVKAFYQDHISWASKWTMMSVNPGAPTMNYSSPSPSSHQPKGNGKGTKDFGKDKMNKHEARQDYSIQEPPSPHPDARTNKFPKFSAQAASSAIQVKPGQEELLKMLQPSGNKPSLCGLAYKSSPAESAQFWLEWCRNCFLGGKSVPQALYA